MKHAPWTKEQAEQWANEYGVSYKSQDEKDAFLAGLAKAAEMIAECPTVYWNDVNDGAYAWEEILEQSSCRTAKLVGVRPIDENPDESLQKTCV